MYTEKDYIKNWLKINRQKNYIYQYKLHKDKICDKFKKNLGKQTEFVDKIQTNTKEKNINLEKIIKEIENKNLDLIHCDEKLLFSLSKISFEHDIDEFLMYYCIYNFTNSNKNYVTYKTIGDIFKKNELGSVTQRNKVINEFIQYVIKVKLYVLVSISYFAIYPYIVRKKIIPKNILENASSLELNVEISDETKKLITNYIGVDIEYIEHILSVTINNISYFIHEELNKNTSENTYCANIIIHMMPLLLFILFNYSKDVVITSLKDEVTYTTKYINLLLNLFSNVFFNENIDIKENIDISNLNKEFLIAFIENNNRRGLTRKDKGIDKYIKKAKKIQKFYDKESEFDINDTFDWLKYDLPKDEYGNIVKPLGLNIFFNILNSLSCTIKVFGNIPFEEKISFNKTANLLLFNKLTGYLDIICSDENWFDFFVRFIPFNFSTFEFSPYGMNNKNYSELYYFINFWHNEYYINFNGESNIKSYDPFFNMLDIIMQENYLILVPED